MRSNIGRFAWLSSFRPCPRTGLLLPFAHEFLGPATLENADILEGVHADYIRAGADVITANTYASSRIMLAAAGLEDRFEEINKAAIEAAMTAREKCGNPDVLVAGSLSCMIPMAAGTAHLSPLAHGPELQGGDLDRFAGLVRLFLTARRRRPGAELRLF